MAGCSTPEYVPPLNGRTATVLFTVASPDVKNASVYIFDSRKCDGTKFVAYLTGENSTERLLGKLISSTANQKSRIETVVPAERELVATFKFQSGVNYIMTCYNTIAFTPTVGAKYTASFDFDGSYCRTHVTRWDNTLGRDEVLASSDKPKICSE